jgi:hypothetical protein
MVTDHWSATLRFVKSMNRICSLRGAQEFTATRVRRTVLDVTSCTPMAADYAWAHNMLGNQHSPGLGTIHPTAQGGSSAASALAWCSTPQIFNKRLRYLVTKFHHVTNLLGQQSLLHAHLLLKASRGSSQ